LLLVLAVFVAAPIHGYPVFGQVTPSKSSASHKEIDDRVAAWLKTCLSDWDRETHMSKGEWRATCQRVAAERRKFLIEEANKGVSFDPMDRTPRKGTRVY